MYTLLVVNPHSMIDVITNSSTELFVCGDDTKETPAMVRALLDARRIFGIGGVALGTEESITQIENEACCDFDARYARQQEWKNAPNRNVFWFGPDDPPRAELMGKILIWGSSDNSIDDDGMDTIEVLFNAKRYHLG